MKAWAAFQSSEKRSLGAAPITLALVHHLAKVDAIAQHGEQVLLIDRATRAMQTTLRDPGLRGLALDGKFAHKLRRRTMLGISAKMPRTSSASAALTISLRSTTSYPRAAYRPSTCL
jgi:hypothetical protein